MKINNRILTWIIAFVMVFAFIPMAPSVVVEANAAENVAEVTDAEGNTTEYETIDAAFSAQSDGCTIKLLNNTTAADKLSVLNNNTITFNLNGKTLDMGDKSVFMNYQNKGELTIHDTTEEHNGSIIGSGRPIATEGAASGDCKLNMKNISITGNGDMAVNLWMGTTAVIDNCIITNNQEEASRLVQPYGIYASGHTDVTIKESQIVTKGSLPAIEVRGNAKVTMSSISIEAANTGINLSDSSALNMTETTVDSDMIGVEVGGTSTVTDENNVIMGKYAAIYTDEGSPVINLQGDILMTGSSCNEKTVPAGSLSAVIIMDTGSLVGTDVTLQGSGAGIVQNGGSITLDNSIIAATGADGQGEIINSEDSYSPAVIIENDEAYYKNNGCVLKNACNMICGTESAPIPVVSGKIDKVTMNEGIACKYSKPDLAAIADGCYAKTRDNNNYVIAPKEENKITVSINAVTKTGNISKDTSFTKAAMSTSGIVKYASSQPKYVKVSASGKVTIVKNWTGTAKITITAPETDNYKAAASKSYTVKVKPGKMTVKKGTNVKGKKIKVAWTKMFGADKYQIQVAYSKNMKKGRKSYTVKGTLATKTTGKLKKGKTYYVQIRAYDNQTKLWSVWSVSKKVKITK